MGTIKIKEVKTEVKKLKSFLDKIGQPYKKLKINEIAKTNGRQ